MGFPTAVVISCMCVYTYIHTYIHTRVYTYIYIDIQIDPNTSIYMYVYRYRSTSTYIQYVCIETAKLLIGRNFIQYTLKGSSHDSGWASGA